MEEGHSEIKNNTHFCGKCITFPSNSNFMEENVRDFYQAPYIILRNILILLGYETWNRPYIETQFIDIDNIFIDAI